MSLMSNRDAAALVASESPPVGSFPAEGCLPAETLIRHLRRASWPMAQVDVEIHHAESVDRSGYHRPARTQITTKSWMKRFAEVTGRPLTDCIRGKYPG